jgi:hypothetical protein
MRFSPPPNNPHQDEYWPGQMLATKPMIADHPFAANDSALESPYTT